MGVSIKIAAEIMGKSQQFVRIGLQRSTLPIRECGKNAK